MSDVPADLQSSFWRGHVRLGALSTATCSVVGIGYALSPGPHRVLIGLVGVLALLSCPVILSAPVTRVMTGPRREPWLYLWSISLLLAVMAGAMLDGGTGSPLAALFFTSLVFTATGFGRSGALAMGGLSVACFLTTAAVGSPGGWHVVLTTTGLVVVAATCALSAGRLRTSLELQEQLACQLRQQALYDGLTGCLNHQALVDRLDVEIAAARTSGAGLGLVMLDLDDFKRANDTHGHLAGDELLRAVGLALRSLARESDVVGRVGGDEFAVLVPGADDTTVQAFAGRVELELRAVGAALAVGVSIGTATLDDAVDGRELRNRADQALYVSKRAGQPL